MTIYTVSTQDEIDATLLKLKGGDIVKIAPGSYDHIGMSNHNTVWDGSRYRYTEKVTITALDAGDPPVFQTLKINGAKNVRIDGLTFKRDYVPDDENMPFMVQSSSGIEVLNSRFTGDLAKGTGIAIRDGYPTGNGLMVRYNQDVLIENNEISTFHNALVFGHNTNGVVRGNNIHGMRNDAIDIFALVNGVIEGNWLHDNAGSPDSGDHRDMIQLWSTSTTRATNGLIIRNNLIDSGSGLATQSIFMRNELVDTGREGSDFRYRNITIEENIIYNSHVNGIMIGNADGVTIRNNSLLNARIGGAYDPDPVSIPAIRAYDVTGLTIQNNITPRIVVSMPGNEQAQIADNLLLGRDLYRSAFISSTTSVNKDGANHWVPVAEGEILGRQVGAQGMLDYANGSPGLRATFGVQGNDLARVFDASQALVVSRLDAADAAYVWDFGDGTFGSGQVVNHAYRAGGRYETSLTLVTRGGLSETSTYRVNVAGPQILDWVPDRGAFLGGAYGENQILRPAGLPVDAEGAIRLFHASRHEVEGVNAVQWKNAARYEIALDVALDPRDGAGAIAGVHGNFKFWVDGNGAARALVVDGTGASSYFKPSTIRVDDGAVHALRIVYDAGEAEAAFLVDDQVMATTRVTGPARGIIGHNLILGTIWGHESIQGRITDLSLTAEQPATTAQEVGNGFTPSLARHRDLTDFILDLDGFLATGRIAHDADAGSEGAIPLSGTASDFVAVGRIPALERSPRIGVSVEFERHRTTSGLERVVTNDSKIEIQLKNGGVSVALPVEGGRQVTLSTGNIGIDDAHLHRVTALLDQTIDRLQLIVDDELELDIRSGYDFDLYAVRAWEAGWSLSSRWNAPFAGSIHDLRLGNDFDFVDTPPGLPLT